MAKKLHILSARGLATLGPGVYADGGCLLLRVRDAHSRAWVFRYKDPRTGKVREIGLGPLKSRTLADARKLAAAMRAAIVNGEDPALLVRPAKEEKAKTFADCARELIEAKRPGWRNPKHVQQWRNTLRDYAFPVIGHKRPDEVNLADIKAILLPLWATKTETATRLRQRIEAVLDFAAVHGLCDGARNPARWRGVLDKVLPAPRRVAAQEHHPAAPYQDVPRIMAALADKRHVSALCLRFLILTAARSGEARGARWSEINLETATWTIPGQRMKAGRPHRVPLSRAALDILREASIWRTEGSDLVFPGLRGQLSDVALSKTLKSVYTGATAHGFRSAFRVWCEEQTSFPRSVSEAALAHVNGDRVEAAYLRTDLFERRRELMEAWARYCTEHGRVVRLARRG